MRAVIQRVSNASVEIEGRLTAKIGPGLLIYLGITKADSDNDAEFIADKMVNLRIFSDENGKMNRSIQEIGGQILLISNFTLYGDCRKGRRPGFDNAAQPALAEKLYEKTGHFIVEKGIKLQKGIFGANMQVSSINDGPVTFILDSCRLF